MTSQIIPVDPDNDRTLARHAAETVIHELPTARLRRRDDCRKLNESNVKNLMEGMRKEGFWKSSPLRVRPIKIRELNDGNIDGWEIISGRHRFEAAWRLNFETAPCVVVTDDDLHAELIMIDENLFRADLEPAEMARQIARRKVIYKELHPETTHGGDRKSSSRTKCDLNRFSKETAEKTGRSERSVQKDARRGEVLGVDLDNIAGTSLDKGTELDALMKMDLPARRELIRRAKAGEKVSAAAKEIENLRAPAVFSSALKKVRKARIPVAAPVPFTISPCTVEAIDEFRRHEPDMAASQTTLSGALERLVELGLETVAKRKGETLLALMTRIFSELEDRLEGSPAGTPPPYMAHLGGAISEIERVINLIQVKERNPK